MKIFAPILTFFGSLTINARIVAVFPSPTASHIHPLLLIIIDCY